MNINYKPDLKKESVQHILPQPFDESYTYDTRGNRLTSLTHSYTYNDLNQLTDSTTHTYSYDADGNLTEEKNKITTETKKYYYNSENRLIGFEHYPNDVSPAETSATYKYDIYGRRLQKNVNGKILNFTWEGDNLGMELDGNLQPILRYVYGVGKDDVEGYVELSEVTGGLFDQYKKGWYSYIRNQVGTISRVYSEYTQEIVDSRIYDVFGNMVNKTGASSGNLGFQSKYFDQESGLYYFYYRYYNPSNGRFMNEDPIGLIGGLNIYNFVENDPVNLIDPFGLKRKKFPLMPRTPGDPPQDTKPPGPTPIEIIMKENVFIKTFTEIFNDITDPKLLCCVARCSGLKVTIKLYIDIVTHIQVETFLHEFGMIILIPHTIHQLEDTTDIIHECYRICKSQM